MMFKKDSFIASIPYIALILGFTFFFFGTFATFDSHLWKEFWSGLGKTILASGIFALLLKTFQFMGVFKEELKKVVYDAKFLANRKDLEEVWEEVSRVMFKNKFPKISKEITHDIGHLYFPTEHVLYYDDYRQIIEIELIDPINQIVNVKQHASFYVYPRSKGENFSVKTMNSLTFNKDKSEVSASVIKYQINEKEATVTITQEVTGNKLNTCYEVYLAGQDSYKFETCIEKRYCLFHDNVIGTVKDFLIHDFSLKLHLKGGIHIDFFEVGTLKRFKNVGVVNEHYREYEYKGILYPKQGYLFFMKKIVP